MSRPRRWSIDVPEADLAELRRRLALARWPGDLGTSGWGEGVPFDTLRSLADHWRDGFDWRYQERRLNELPQYRATVDGVDLHFVHLEGSGPDPLPLVLTHGWPSSFFEYSKVARPLADPAAFGGDRADAFHVVVPAYPGYPFSGPASPVGIAGRVPALWRALMCDVLGYERFGAFGGDVGAAVTAAIGRDHADAVIGIQVLAVLADAGLDDPTLSAAEREFLLARGAWGAVEGGYSHMQQTRPRTLAYGLSDSPLGLLAWIVEKFRQWSDCDGEPERSFTRDELLTTPTLYWAANCIGASFRPYVEAGDIMRPRGFGRIDVPVGVALFPADLPVPPREYAERHYDVRRWTEMPRGGHFAALEEPELVVEEIRAFFRPLRPRSARISAATP